MPITIAILLSESETIELRDGTTTPCGFWAEELITAHRALTDAGATIVLTTPTGRPAHPEPDSLLPPHSTDPVADHIFLNALPLDHPVPLAELETTTLDGIFVPGGYGPVADLHDNTAVGRVLAELREANTPIAAVCHGTAALLADTGGAGGWPYAGLELAGFSDREETSVGLLDLLPFTVEREVRRRGGSFSSTEPWAEHVVHADHVVTGQNPASTATVAAALLDRITSAAAVRT